MIDKFTIKELLAFVIFLNIGGLTGIYVCWQLLRAGLRDHHVMYKKLVRIAGDLPE